MLSYGKNKNKKTFEEFGPFSALSVKIRAKLGRRFVRPLTFLFSLFSFVAEESAKWEHCSAHRKDFKFIARHGAFRCKQLGTEQEKT
jgi:hypothetical protein